MTVRWGLGRKNENGNFCTLPKIPILFFPPGYHGHTDISLTGLSAGYVRPTPPCERRVIHTGTLHGLPVAHSCGRGFRKSNLPGRMSPTSRNISDQSNANAIFTKLQAACLCSITSWFCEMLANKDLLNALWAGVLCRLYFLNGWLAESSPPQPRRAKILRQHFTNMTRMSDFTPERDDYTRKVQLFTDELLADSWRGDWKGRN